MPDVIRRNEFVKALSNARIDVDDAVGDPKLASRLPGNADLDKNGVITGQKEMDALFTQVDSFGRDPNAQQLELTGADGFGTDAAAVLQSLGKLSGLPEVKAWTLGLKFQTQRDWSQFVAPKGSWGNAEAMQGAGAKLVREQGNHYGTLQSWFNLDPNHALPANKELRGLGVTERNPNGVWKCNLFGGNALYVAGFEPPYYGNKGKGEYPNANQFWKFSDKYASKYGNKSHFKMVGELNVESLSYEERGAAIAKLLKSAQPGDLLMVDHLGKEVTDGGHTRVVMSNELGPNGEGRIHSAQATFDGATVRAEGLSAFTNEEHIWILRPNRPRTNPNPTVTPTPAPAPEPKPSNNTTTTYVVKSGDTLSGIARKLLGSANRWPEIAKANPDLKNPSVIRAGQKLIIPAK